MKEQEGDIARVACRHKAAAFVYTSRFLFTTDGIIILDYKAKTKKDVFLLSSMHTAPVVNENEAKKKPEAILCNIIILQKVALILLTKCFDATARKLNHGNGH